MQTKFQKTNERHGNVAINFQSSIKRTYIIYAKVITVIYFVPFNVTQILALQYVHHHGYLHNDVKPKNIATPNCYNFWLFGMYQKKYFTTFKTYTSAFLIFSLYLLFTVHCITQILNI